MVNQRFQSLSPADLLIHKVEIGPERIVIAACCRAVAGIGPECGRPSGRVHSRCERLLDLPSHGRTVQLRVAVRRFRCTTCGCRRRIFAERLDPRVAERSARRTFRLEAIVHHLGIALCGRPAATLAQRLMLPVSKDTLLRAVRRPAARNGTPLCVVGLDDRAWKKSQRYGSIVCDLERRCVVDLSQTARSARWRPGCHGTWKSVSSRAIAGADTVRLPLQRHRRPFRLPIAGI